jgi:hypothetical protein
MMTLFFFRMESSAARCEAMKGKDSWRPVAVKDEVLLLNLYVPFSDADSRHGAGGRNGSGLGS